MKQKYILTLAMLAALSPAGMSAQNYTYENFEKEVLSYSQTLKQSVADQTAMKKAMEAAKTNFLPSVDGAGHYQYMINNSEGMKNGVPMNIDPDSYNLSYDVTQPIFAGGSIYFDYKGKKLQSAIADQNVQLTTDNVILAAEASYWGTSAQKEMYLVMKRYNDIVGQLLGVLEERFADGMISKTDLIQMQVRKEEAEMQCLNTLEQYKLAMQNMNVMMGKNPTDTLNVLYPIAKRMKLPTLSDLETVWNLRPELAMAILQRDYEKNQIKLTHSKYNPTVSLGYQGAWGTVMPNFDNEDEFNHSLVISLKVPIWHWGARFKEAAAQRALYHKAQFALQDQRDQISKELSAAWTQVQDSQERIVIALRNCKLADKNLDLNTYSYTEGRLSILDVLGAQITWLQAYTNLVQSNYQEKIAFAEYKKASGSRYQQQ